MYNPTEQIAELNKAGYANALRFAALSIENAEKIVKLNLAAAKTALAKSVESTQAIAGVKDVQDLMAVRAKLTEEGVEAATGYSRSLYELSSAAQAEMSALAEETWAAYTKGVASFVDNASKSAPAGSDVAVNAFKSTFAASTAAFDQFQKAAKQVVSLADANVRAAAAQAVTASKPVAKGRRAA